MTSPFPAADRYLLGAPGWSGLGEDLPKGVFEQWVSWVMSKRYLFDDPELGGLKNFPQFNGAMPFGVRHSGMVRRTRPQMCNCTSGNLEIPGSMRSLSSGRALRGPVGIAPE